MIFFPFSHIEYIQNSLIFSILKSLKNSIFFKIKLIKFSEFGPISNGFCTEKKT